MEKINRRNVVTIFNVITEYYKSTSFAFNMSNDCSIIDATISSEDKNRVIYITKNADESGLRIGVLYYLEEIKCDDNVITLWELEMNKNLEVIKFNPISCSDIAYPSQLLETIKNKLKGEVII